MSSGIREQRGAYVHSDTQDVNTVSSVDEELTVKMGPARVLLVDDDQLFIRRLQRALDGQLDLQVATSGRDALTQTASWTPDVVVIDPLLGDVDSFGILDQLRDSRPERNLGVICLSRGAGSLTRYHRANGRFFGTVMRESGTEAVCDALRFALGFDSVRSGQPA